MADTQEKILMRAFGKRVAELRRKRGMAQEQLAAKIDSHVTTIAFIEGGTKFVRLTTLRKLAQALDVEVKQLFEGVK
jgi:ribosome-binding protein aMBF1 (putative translation factor)